jgi:O-antigen ligase
MAPASILRARLVQLGIPAIAALVGVVAGLSPKLGIAAAVGLVYVVIVVESLALGVALFMAVTFMESVSAFSGLSLAKGAGALLAFSWLALVATDRRRGRQLVADHPALAATLVALGAWAALSAAWAELPTVSYDGATRWILNLMLFPIVYAAVRSPRHVRWVFALFIVGALVSAALGVATGTATDDARLAGEGVNANELGELLVVAVVLAGALGASRSLPSPARAVSYAAAGLSVIALLMTASRGALVGLLVALLVAPLLIGPGRRLAALALVVLSVAGGATYLLAYAPAADLQRITQADTTGTGRTDIWKVGWRMVEANPLTGVGVGNYNNSTVHYLFEPGTITRSDFIVDDPKAAHNIYLQVLAELGIPGLAFMLLIVGTVLVYLLKAARGFARAGDHGMDLLSRALLVALCGLLAALFFSTAIYSKQLWLLLATGVAIHALSRERAAAP